MPIGMQVFNEDGSLRTDLAKRYSKLMGSIYTWQDGSLWVPEFSLGEPFFIVTPDSSMGDKGKRPVVVVSGNTLSWWYAYAPNQGFYNKGVTIDYGYY